MHMSRKLQKWLPRGRVNFQRRRRQKGFFGNDGEVPCNERSMMMMSAPPLVWSIHNITRDTTIIVCAGSFRCGDDGEIMSEA